MVESRWEHGSEFHWVDFPPGQPRWPWGEGALLYSTGRDALQALMKLGRARHGWRRLWLPSYFCQDVVRSLLGCGLDCCVYPDHPLRSAPDLSLDVGRADVVFIANYFGLREGVDVAGLKQRGAAIVEDHTHDPWSRWASESQADYCIASLRKTLPLPDGGALWSPRGATLPTKPELSASRARAADEKLQAMLLKRLYLQGHSIDREAFRSLAIRGEQGLETGGPSDVSPLLRAVLHVFPVDEWRSTRRSNWNAFLEVAGASDHVRVVEPANKDCVPFSCIVLLPSEGIRNAVRASLIDARIYPAILWTLEQPAISGIDEDASNVSKRMLSLHCDGRYTADDLARVARELLARVSTIATEHDS